MGRGSITVWLVSSLTELDFTKQENMWGFVCTETCDYKLQTSQTGDQQHRDTFSTYVECSLVR